MNVPLRLGLALVCSAAGCGGSSDDAPSSIRTSGDAGTDASVNGTDASAGDVAAGDASSGDAAAAADGGLATVPGDSTGTTALRIADLMESFGANVYSNQQDGASGETVAGLTKVQQYLTGSSGLAMMFRGYVGSASQYDTFGPQLFPATGGGSASP